MALTPLTESDDLMALVQAAEDDTNESPWMTMPEFQYVVIRLLDAILRLHGRRRRLGWHVGGELDVRMPKPAGGTLGLGPDLFVVEADAGLRTSWNVVAEGQPPRLVLEVVTADSVTRDTDREQKVAYYQAMGVEEYAIYWPERKDGGPRLFGYRRDEASQWVAWGVDGQGVLWSAALGGLGLVQGEYPFLRVIDTQGRLLPSPEEEAERVDREVERTAQEARRAERAVRRAEQEAAARRAAEERAQREAWRAAQEERRADQEAADRQAAEDRAVRAEAELERLRKQLEDRQG